MYKIERSVKYGIHRCPLLRGERVSNAKTGSDSDTAGQSIPR